MVVVVDLKLVGGDGVDCDEDGGLRRKEWWWWI